MWIITTNGPEDIEPPSEHDDALGSAWAHTKDVSRYLEGELPREYGDTADQYSAEDFRAIWQAHFDSWQWDQSVAGHNLELDLDSIDEMEEAGEFDDVDWESSPQ